MILGLIAVFLISCSIELFIWDYYDRKKKVAYQEKFDLKMAKFVFIDTPIKRIYIVFLMAVISIIRIYRLIFNK